MTRLTLFAFSMAMLLPCMATASEGETTKPEGPSLVSTSKQYREYAFLNDVCRKEFGEGARVADFNDLKRMIRTRSDYEAFIKSNGLGGRSRERLLYYNGQFKSPRDRHYYLIYNPDGVTPRGVNAIGRLRGNSLNLAAIMHIRARVLCFVP
ncbi:hypothetical protein KBA39_05350 [Myxococcota bacterium]|nr:hypothetical protein [Myxococcota bacterium]